jgi:hypothetical protein
VSRAKEVHALASSPSLDVYVSGYKPVPSFVPYWPESWQATWPATTSTLISGATDAVALVTGRCEMSPTEAARPIWR